LAGEGADFLDESLQQLTATFQHEFSEDEFPAGQFGLITGKLVEFDAQPTGLQVTRPGGDGYIGSTIGPHLSVEGDFDIIASYDQFEPSPSLGGSSGLFLHAFLDSAKSNECLIYRRHLQHRLVPQPIIQASYVTREVGGARRDRFNHEVVEAKSGRLRLARRGETVYYLFAEGDSPNFRLFGSRTATKDDLRSVRLTVQTHGEGLTKVVWKSLTIRAEKLSGMALLRHQDLLAELDKQRAALPHRFEHDFAKDPMTANRFQRWGAAVSPPPDKDGFRFVSPGTDNWTSVGLAPQLGLKGDFDIAVTLDAIEFAKPKEKLNSAFYLQVELPDEAKTQANIILLEHPDGHRQVYAQIRLLDAAGKREYRRIRIDSVNALESMRITRRGGRASFIYRRKGSDHDQILAQTDLLELPIPTTYVRLMLHTGGRGRQSEVLLKQLRIHAEKIDPIPRDGLLKSLLNLFGTSR